MTTSLLSAALSGLALGLGLIIAIGAQNSFVLRQGLRREHLAVVVGICVVSDVILIALGVSGAGLLVDRLPGFVDLIRWAGAAFLLGYAALVARRALRPATSLEADGAPPPRSSSLGAAIATTLALTWLNPHVYLDTVVLLGSIAAGHGEERWAFGAGAALGSVIWFVALGFGARLLAPVFRRPIAWRVLDAGIAVVMIGIAASLVLSA